MTSSRIAAGVCIRATIAACLTLSITPALTVGPARANPFLVFEPGSGRVLDYEDADRLWHPASLTKMMTAYLTFEAVKSGKLTWSQKLEISPYARSQPATRIGLKPGIDVTIDQAVRGLIIRSANDFAVALAENVAGGETAFVERMNATATRLGMSRTHFVNPHGLPDPEQVTTARDMAILATAIAHDFPEHADVFSTHEIAIGKTKLRTVNGLLLTYDGADGIKTGFTCASGYNIVASATRNGRRLVAVLLGEITGAARTQRVAQLLTAGFARDQASAAGAPALQLATLPMPATEPLPAGDLTHVTATSKCGNVSRRGARSVIAKGAPAPKSTPKASKAPHKAGKEQHGTAAKAHRKHR